ncbi:MAG TPA: peptidoglycan DD-metalloendopeptidase family protein [Steroidobacteraceae bacterium]|jgi:septal ring factor EnvC (AmiA/AmiB activator)|nr:peptidoglycan DD-metalloendopeptidase family protein [Steroidobacteraceae bacterium]
MTRFAPAVLIALTLSLICAALAATPQRTEAQLRSLREKIERMTQQVSRDAVQRDRLSANLRAAEMSVGQARGEMARIGREYADRSERRNSLSTERGAQQRALSQERQALAGELRAAYLIGRAEPLKLLLAARDPLRSARLFAYYGYFGRARAREISAIQQHVQRLDGLDAELAQQQSELANLKGAQQSQLQQLERSRSDRQRVLSSLDSEARTRAQSLARLKTQQADLEQLLSQLNRSLKAVPPPETSSAFGRLRGQLAWPVAGRVTAAFGDTRASGVKWDGVVVATERGAPVKAVSSGRLVYADWLPGLGLLAIVDHGEGYLSLYGHNERLYKAAGESVAAGEVIAAAGDSGGRPEPELYFEIRREGHPVDPRPWFRERRPGP